MSKALGIARTQIAFPGGGLRCWAGDVVPYDDPALVAGGIDQRHLLRPAKGATDAQITPHENAAVAALHKAQGYQRVPFKDPAAPKKPATETIALQPEPMAAGGGKGAGGKKTATGEAPEPEGGKG